MGRRRVSLGIGAGVVAAAAVVVTLGECGSSSQQRGALVAYIHDVNAVQEQMRPKLAATMNAYRTFSKMGTISPKRQRQLRIAEQTFSSLRRRIAALPAPPSAVKLRGLVVALVAAEFETAHEVRLLAEFIPPYGRALKQTGDAGVRLQRGLDAVKTPQPRTLRGTPKQVAAARSAFEAASAGAASAQADAIDAYLADIAKSERQLRLLEPPPVMRPAWRAQLTMLARSRVTGSALAAALRKRTRTRLDVLGRRFTVATRAAGTVGAQKAQIAAINAYNRRVRAGDGIRARIQNELARLQARTG